MNIEQYEQRQNVIVFGTGLSSEYFVRQFGDKFNIVAIADRDVEQEQFEGLPLIEESSITQYQFDKIIVASWAIIDVTERLVGYGISKTSILWFQHHKNRLVDSNHEDALESHKELTQQEILYAFYDLNAANPAFDIIAFLCMAEVKRIEKGLKAIHFIIANPDNNDFNVAMRGIINKKQHDWRVRHILLPSCYLIDSCSGVSITSNRQEVMSYVEQASHIFPGDYNPEAPREHHEFNRLFELAKDDIEFRHLSARKEAKEQIKSMLQELNPTNKKVVSITLRTTTNKPARNSNLESWIRFVNHLDTTEYFPLLIPDTENVLTIDRSQFDSCLIVDAACYDVELRMACYEQSYVNMGVNNGPMFLCALSQNCSYIILKQIVNDYYHSSKQSFLKRGFVIGSDFPGATFDQKLVWEDDTFEVIKKSFDDFVRYSDLNSTSPEK